MTVFKRCSDMFTNVGWCRLENFEESGSTTEMRRESAWQGYTEEVNHVVTGDRASKLGPEPLDERTGKISIVGRRFEIIDVAQVGGVDEQLSSQDRIDQAYELFDEVGTDRDVFRSGYRRKVL